MSFNFGLNTGLGFGNNFSGLNLYQTNGIDYSGLNTFSNSIMNQLNSMSYSPINQLAVQGSMNNWFNNIASCFTVNSSMLNQNNPFNFNGLNFGALANGGFQNPSVTNPQQTPEEKAEAAKKAEEEKAKKEETKAKEEKARKEASEICEELYVAMKGWGTDEAAVDRALARVTEDNVLEVMEIYLEQYSESMDGETLIGSIQDDYSGSDEKRIISLLKEKLSARASKMGLDTEAKAFRAKVTAESNGWSGNWGADDEVVDGAFNSLLAAMITKRAQG